MQAEFIERFASAFDNDKHRAFRRNGHADNSKAALLIHGFPGTPYEMQQPADLLHAQGWTVEAPLLPGFGTDIPTLPERTYQDWLTATGSALERLRREHDTVIICGNSMGGSLALCLAAQQPVDGLILFAPFWRVEHFLWQMLPVVNFFVDNIKPFRLFKPDFSDPNFRQSVLDFIPEADIDDPEVRQHILNFEVPVGMFNQIRNLGRQAYRCIPQVDVPALIFQGTQDELVTPGSTQQLIERFNSPVQYEQLPGDHEMIIADDATWQPIRQHMRDFTARIPAGAIAP